MTAAELLAALPADVPDQRTVRQATKLEAPPPADLGAKPSPAARDARRTRDGCRTRRPAPVGSTPTVRPVAGRWESDSAQPAL